MPAFATVCLSYILSAYHPPVFLSDFLSVCLTSCQSQVAYLCNYLSVCHPAYPSARLHSGLTACPPAPGTSLLVQQQEKQPRLKLLSLLPSWVPGLLFLSSRQTRIQQISGSSPFPRSYEEASRSSEILLTGANRGQREPPFSRWDIFTAAEMLRLSGFSSPLNAAQQSRMISNTSLDTTQWTKTPRADITSRCSIIEAERLSENWENVPK